MKFLVLALTLIASSAFADDLGMYSDGGTLNVRVYVVPYDRLIIRQDETIFEYDYSYVSSDYISLNEDNSLDHVKILDDDNILWQPTKSAHKFLTKKNICQ